MSLKKEMTVAKNILRMSFSTLMESAVIKKEIPNKVCCFRIMVCFGHMILPIGMWLCVDSCHAAICHNLGGTGSSSILTATPTPTRESTIKPNPTKCCIQAASSHKEDPFLLLGYCLGTGSTANIYVTPSRHVGRTSQAYTKAN